MALTCLPNRPSNSSAPVTRWIGGCLFVLFLLSSMPPAHGQRLDLRQLSADQIAALDKDRTVVIIPVGVIEEHGPYLPSYTDGYEAEYETDLLARAIAKRPGWKVLVHPILPVGTGGANNLAGRFSYHGTYALRFETLRALFMDLGEEFAMQGFKWIFIVSAHAAPDHNLALDQASDYVHDEYGTHMVNLFRLSADGKMPDARSEELQAHEQSAPHGGSVETSAMLFLRPKLVRQGHDKAEKFIGKSWEDLTRIAADPQWTGYFGDPGKASKELGKRYLQIKTERLIGTALHILDGVDYRSYPRFSKTSMVDFVADDLGNDAAGYNRARGQRQESWLKKNATTPYNK